MKSRQLVAEGSSTLATCGILYLKSVSWVNSIQFNSFILRHTSRGLSIKVYLNEVYVGMFHGAEPCTMRIDVFHILHNYSNIVNFRCNFQTYRGIYIWCKWMPISYSWRAHTSSYSACAFMTINGYTIQLADTENKLYYLHFYLNVNDSQIHVHGLFIYKQDLIKINHIYT